MKVLISHLPVNQTIALDFFFSIICLSNFCRLSRLRKITPVIFYRWVQGSVLNHIPFKFIHLPCECSHWLLHSFLRLLHCFLRLFEGRHDWFKFSLKLRNRWIECNFGIFQLLDNKILSGFSLQTLSKHCVDPFLNFFAKSLNVFLGALFDFF